LEVHRSILRKTHLDNTFFPARILYVHRRINSTGTVKYPAVLLLILVLVITFSLVVLLLKQPANKPSVFAGVDIGYGDEAEAIKIVNAVSGYVNLIVLGSLEVTKDTEKLMRVCDYMYQKGLYFMVYVGFGHESNMPPEGPNAQFFTTARERWGEKLLGAYIFDELGGKQLDGPDRLIGVADNYSDAASLYVHHMYTFVGNVTAFYSPANVTLYTSDYALIWYDYASGYDVVFGEFVENKSRQLAIALSRGAAKTLDKDWGIIITYSEQNHPTLRTPNNSTMIWSQPTKMAPST